MIFVDTNVVVDLLEPDPRWSGWSGERLAEAALHDRVVASTVVVAECAGRFGGLSELRTAFAALDIEIDDVPIEAMFSAGHAFRAYRRGGAVREKILADFLIAAHAVERRAALITRDTRLYRSYFPDLTLITPETDA